MGVVSTSEGSGAGTARVSLAVDMRNRVYRLVTDLRPRAGTYTITTTSAAGPGRVTDEDLHFAFGDHHYSYVDLSALEAQRAIPAVAEALGDIRQLLSNRPPNVFMGFFDWSYDEDGVWAGDMGDYHVDHLAWSYGAKGEATREILLRISCPELMSQFEAIWGPS